jgi:hypothetical protein
MTLPVGPLRPNTATVQRKGNGGSSNAGDPLPSAATTVLSGLPCFIGMAMASLRADLVDSRMGPNVQSDYVLIADGIAAGGAAPGTTITKNGIPYVVAANGRDAFPDIRDEDRITREDGVEFLVVGPPMTYTDVFPCIQAHLVYGKAWG